MASVVEKCLHYKQLLDEAFVISRIIKVEVGVIFRSRRLWLITLTETLIILDITKTSSNNCITIHWMNPFFLVWTSNCFQSLCQLFLILRFSQFFLFHVISKQLLCHLRRPFCVCESLSSTTFLISCSVNEANLEVMFLLLHWRQATQSTQTWHDYP